MPSSGALLLIQGALLVATRGFKWSAPHPPSKKKKKKPESTYNIHWKVHGQMMVGNRRWAKSQWETGRKKSSRPIHAQVWRGVAEQPISEETLFPGDSSHAMHFFIQSSLWTGSHHKSLGPTINTRASGVCEAQCCDIFVLNWLQIQFNFKWFYLSILCVCLCPCLPLSIHSYTATSWLSFFYIMSCKLVWRLRCDV